MKKIIAYVLVVLCVVLASSCTAGNDKQSADYDKAKNVYSTNEDVFSVKDYISLSLDETISLSTNVVKARFIEAVFGDYSEDLFFAIEDQYKGNADTEIIRVYNQQNLIIVNESEAITHEDESLYIPGEEYLLLLDCIDYVYFDQKMYRLISKAYFPFNDIDEARLNGELLKNSGYDFKNTQELLAYVSDVSDFSDQSKEFHIKYTKSDDVFEISQKADVIARIKVLEHIRYIKLFDADVYGCELIEVSKGSIGSKNIEIVFFKDSVKADEEYTVYLVNTHADNYFFLASPYGCQRAGVSDRD